MCEEYEHDGVLYLLDRSSQKVYASDGENAFIGEMSESGLDVDEVGFIDHPSILMSGASPDGMIKSEDAVLEIKCPTPTTHLNNLLADKMPSNYKYQVQWQIACTGSKKAYFCSYNPNYPERFQLKIVEVARDDKMISAMEAAARQFNIEIEDLITKLENTNG